MFFLCGVDEAGRGPLAGAVYAAAVILDPLRPIVGLADSKTLSAPCRQRLASLIKEHALAWQVAYSSVAEIDQLNILKATFLAMTRAINQLPRHFALEEILIDGHIVPPGLAAPARAIIKGDASVAEISAASILAKTERDAELLRLDQYYPEYGFAQHKGYPTAKHLAAIERFGVSPIHRKTFRPIKNKLQNGSIDRLG